MLEIVIEILREPILELFISIVGLFITLRFIPRKQLTCRIEEVPQKDRTFIAKIDNSGNTTIESNDYERNQPICISINRGDIKCTIQNVKPDNMHAEVKSQDNKITIKPLLFNPKDSLNIEFTLDSPIHIDEITCHARIAGMKNDIKVFYSKQNEKNWDNKEKISTVLIRLALICEVTALVLILWVIFKS